MTVKLTKEGKFLTRKWVPPVKWNEEAEKFEDEGHHDYFNLETYEGILCRLEEHVILGKGVTLTSLFTAIKDLREYQKLGIYLGNGYMEEFIAEFFMPAESDTEITEFVWDWVPEISNTYIESDDFLEDSEIRTIENSFSFYGNVSGVGDPVKSDGYNYAIDGCPQNIYKDVLLRLDNTFRVPNKDDWKATPVLDVVRLWTLGEFLRSYFYELSWHGGPKEREEFNEMMSEQLEGLRNGTLKTYPFDMGRLLEDDINKQ